MKLRGKIFSGVLRGISLIDYYYHRIVGLVGFQPFKGTMNVRLEKEVDIELYYTKEMSHILVDGTKKVDALLAPVTLTISGQEHQCWALRDMSGVYGKDVIEVVSRDNIKSRFSVKDGDEVIVAFVEQRRKKKALPGMGLMAKLYGVEGRTMKGN